MRSHSRLSNGRVRPPSFCHRFSETRLALSLMESFCGPFAKDRSNLAPASGFSSGLSTISDPAIAARIFLPRKHMCSGSTPRKPRTAPSGET